MAIQIGGTTVIDNSRNVNAGIATFTRLDVPPIPITFSPAIGSTNVSPTSNIIITFDQLIQKRTGNITLRSNSAGGTAFSTIAVSSGTVTISGGAVTIDPPSPIGSGVTAFVVVDAGAFSGITTTSVNALINTYNFTAEVLAPGSAYEGGYLICMASPVRWIVSPRSVEVSRTWYSRNDANTTAQAVSGCTGWFVPHIGQLRNPGYLCRSFWGSFSSTAYWSSSQRHSDRAYCLNFTNAYSTPIHQTNTICVRAFRCVTY